MDKAYGRNVECLVDGQSRTTKEEHMWSCPYQAGQKLFLVFTLPSDIPVRKSVFDFIVILAHILHLRSYRNLIFVDTRLYNPPKIDIAMPSLELQQTNIGTKHGSEGGRTSHRQNSRLDR